RPGESAAGIELLLAAADEGERAILLGAVTAAGAVLGERTLALRLDGEALCAVADSDDGSPAARPLPLAAHPALRQALAASTPSILDDAGAAELLSPTGRAPEGTFHVVLAPVLALPLTAGARCFGLLIAAADPSSPPLDAAFAGADRIARLA